MRWLAAFIFHVFTSFLGSLLSSLLLIFLGLLGIASVVSGLERAGQ
jgi:hypothetical protein